MYLLSLDYALGDGVAEDAEQARTWLMKAAEGGYSDAMVQLANRYADGYAGFDKDRSKAADWYGKAADRGNSEGLYALAELYREGEGVEQSDAKALDLYSQAAEKGFTLAMRRLGEVYSKGKLAKRDPAAAWRWYSEAADDGDPASMLAVGEAYETGSLVPKDVDAAREWYLKLVALDVPYDEVLHAEWRLSKAYYSGSLGVRSYPEAARLLIEAAKGGLKPAIDALKSPALKELNRDMRKAVQQTLTDAKAYEGTIDGNIGPATLKAIDAYLEEDD
jgi:TPR repeat protein